MQASQAKESTVNLPRAIVRRSAAIQARIDARNKPPEPKAEPADPTAPAPADPTAATPADPTPPAPEPQPVDPRENDPAYWRQRFNVTAGVLRTEREQRKGENEGFHQRISELEGQIRTLQTSAPSPAADTAIDVTQFFTPEQIEQFGEEQCKAMAKAAIASAKAAVNEAIEKEVKPLREAQTRKAAETEAERKQSFVDRLTELVPNYQEIDVDPAWLSWLAQEDESSGEERQGILTRHIAAQNAAKVARMFEAFLKTRKPRPQPPVVGSGTGAGPSGDPPPPASPNAAKPPTDVEVRDFYKRAALGRVKDAERIEFEARMKLRTSR